jgi:hypothetical protein
MSEQSSGSDSLEDDLQRVGAILESVAGSFPPGSKESLAIRDAALAYQIVRMNKALRKSYERWRSAFDGKITDDELEEMNANLRLHGFDPDALQDDLEDDASAGPS